MLSGNCEKCYGKGRTDCDRDGNECLSSSCTPCDSCGGSGMANYPMQCCEFHKTGGHSADRHGLDSAGKVYMTTDVDAHLRANADPNVPNVNVR